MKMRILLAVRHKEGKREAVIEFPPELPPKFGAPQLKGAIRNPEASGCLL